ncbi:MAG: hypothetical protein OXT09_24920, partial [Myxococcales bacterium]|nr:hypothetical protein [Myxococcales bacterium]
MRGHKGDGSFIVSELRAYCQKPEPFPPVLKLPPPKTWWSRIDSPLMISIKGLVSGRATAHDGDPAQGEARG